MQALQTLERGGYAIGLRVQDGIAVVEAKRTATTEMSAKLAAPLLLALSRNQDEAMQHMAGVLYQRIASNTGPDDEIVIAEYNVCVGQAMTSDGLRWVDVLASYRAERDAASNTMRRAA